MWASVAAAQETVNYASVSGRVTDQQGMVVPGATVTARQVATNITTGTTSDTSGRFRFPYLRVGAYEIMVELIGFKTFTRQVTLTLGSAFDLPVSLAIDSLTETITIVDEAPVIEASRSQVAGTVSQAEVTNLPLNGRNFLDIALVVPGVSQPNLNSTQLFAETSANTGNGISVGSQRNFSNNFIVDGLSANDDAAGLSGMPYGVDAVDQFQVVTSGGQAELGRALGGYVNVVTKSGTNTTRGDVYGYFRDDSLNAKNVLSGAKLPMSQKQYGVSLGGPVAKNKTFYFANIEQRLLDQTGLTTISDANVAIINTRLSAVAYPGANVATGIYDNPVHSVNLLGKIDHQFSGKDLFTVRYSLYDVRSDNARGAGGLNAPSASAGLDNRDQALAIGNTTTLGPRTVNELRAQFVRANLLAPPTDPVGPAVSIAGVASFGTLSGSPTARLNRMYQVVDNLSHQTGAHALRAGVDFLFNDDHITYPRSVRGSYAFSSMASFLTGVYNNAGFTQTFGASDVAQTNANVGVYAQDEWKAGDRLTINLGLRYDLQYLETITTDTNNVSPRIGFAWTPTSSRNLVVRGNAGLFYDRLPLRALANALLSAGNTTNLDNLRQTAISLSPTQAGAPVFPNILAAPVPTVTLFNLATMDPNMQNAYSEQASLEIERQIGNDGTISVGYSHMKGVHLIMSVNQNVPSCVATGTNNGCRPIAEYGNNNQYSSVADSKYDGLQVSFAQRPSRLGYYRISYTLSKSMNNVGENFFSSPIDPFDIWKDWGRSDGDQRHRLVVSGAVNAAGFQISGMVQAYAALPFNITSGVTTIQGAAGRPTVDGEFIERNAGVADTFFSSSLRVSRAFPLGDRVKLEGLVEIFNLTNHRNDITRNTNFRAGAYPTNPSPTYNQITAVGDPRSAQLGIRLRF
jgi:outer membrane receptor protein involved in Fe transport